MSATYSQYNIPHAHPFDPTYGYDEKSLLEIGLPDNEPEDFDVFWKDLYKKTLSIKTELKRKPSRFESETHKVEEVYFLTLGHYHIGAYLITPKNGVVERIQVEGHGYGGREAPNLEIKPTTASLNPIAPGFHLSAHSTIPLNDSSQHVIHKVEDKNTYIFRNCAAAWWSAATVMLELYPKLSETLIYRGWSFGGGMGCLMLPWDNRYKGAELGQVSFCHIPIRLTCSCAGSGDATTRFFREHPSVLQNTLRYFDAAFAAKRILVPVVFCASLFDPCVPPPGQFAAYNVCEAPKRLSKFLVGHFDYQHENSDAEHQNHLNNLEEFGFLY